LLQDHDPVPSEAVHRPAGQRWAVIGGGFLGMTLAIRLAQQGKTVTLFEAAPFLGGVAAPWRLGDIVWDRHYHVILSSDTHLRALLRELQLEAEVIWKKVGTGFYVDSRLHSISNAYEFLRFPPLGIAEKARLAATILRACCIKDPSSLETIPVEPWLLKWSGAAVTQKLWLPLLRAKLGESYRQTSAAFIWATIARLCGARRTGGKAEVFGYVPGGYARIIERFGRLLRQNGVQLRLNQAVGSITSNSAGKLRIELGSSPSEVFSHAVVTTAAPLALSMCPGLSSKERDQLGAIRYQGIVCASLLLKSPLSRFYLTNIADPRVPYTAVVEMSALVDRGQLGGRGLVYLPKYVAPDSRYFSLSDEQIRQEFEPAFAQMYPNFKCGETLSFQVSRVKYLLPIPTLDYSANLPSTTTSVHGLYIVNSAQIVDATLNVNATVRLAESAARDLLGCSQ
jgi:protoporphyrinogen oxidase